jgi:hypothetical protein
MLRVSLHKIIQGSTLDFLGMILPLPGSSINFAFVVECLNIFTSCFVPRVDGMATVLRGSEQLAEGSALCFLRAFASWLGTEPIPAAIENIHKRYKRILPSTLDPCGLPVAVLVLHSLFSGEGIINWASDNPLTDKLALVSRALARMALEHCSMYRSHTFRAQRSRWFTWGWANPLVHFSLHFLSQNPLPPASVIIDCLTIIATNVAGVPDAGSIPSEEKCVCSLKTVI